jgi:hypothetical protein
MGLLGNAYGFENWLWFLLAMLGVLVLAFLVRQIGWPNLTVPEELRSVPGLMTVKFRLYRDRRRASGPEA